MGDETNGRKYLEEAAKRDAFNVRTYNILNLFEDTIPQRYVMFSAGKVFRFRVAKDEKAMLERYVPRLLDKAWAEMVKRYGYTTPTTTACAPSGPPISAPSACASARSSPRSRRRTATSTGG